MIQVINYDPRDFSPVFSVQLGTTVPEALGFADNVAMDLFIFGLFNGYLYVYADVSRLLKTDEMNRLTVRGDDGKVVSTHEISPMM